jgi:phage FluMu gp28-like protein
MLGLRKAMESGQIRIARDRDLAHELNRTKRITGGRIEQPTMGRKSHYDRAWATAMAGTIVSGETISIYDSHGLVSLDLVDA